MLSVGGGHPGCHMMIYIIKTRLHVIDINCRTAQGALRTWDIAEGLLPDLGVAAAANKFCNTAAAIKFLLAAAIKLCCLTSGH